MFLAYYTLPELVLQMQNRLDIILYHSANRNPGPIGNYRTNGLCIDAGKNQGPFSLHVPELVLQRNELFE